MNKIEVNHIILNGVTYPAYCDLRVIDEIQKEYGAISDFERLLLGRKVVYDEDGNPERNDDGTIVQEVVDPSVDAIVKGLYYMIREGQRIEDPEGEEITLEDIYTNTGNLFQLNVLVHGIFMKCFELKKKEEPERPTTRKTKK